MARLTIKIWSDLRHLGAAQSSVSDIKHAALVPEVSHALLQWIKQKAVSERSVLIGGVAMSFYSKPRYTTDADFLFLSDEDIPQESPEGFRRNRKGAFENKRTGVEIEVCTPQAINLPTAIAKKVFSTSHLLDGVRVASLEGLIALKLIGAETPKREHRDLGDIQTLIESNSGRDLSLADWPLSPEQRTRLNKLIEVSRL